MGHDAADLEAGDTLELGATPDALKLLLHGERVLEGETVAVFEDVIVGEAVLVRVAVGVKVGTSSVGVVVAVEGGVPRGVLVGGKVARSSCART